MGAVYYVDTTLKFKDEQEFIRKSKKFIEDYNGTKARFCLANGNMETVDGIIKIIIHKDAEKHDVLFGGSRWEAWFSASYGWESIMMEWFEYVAETLDDGSELYIEPDNDSERLTIAHSLVKYS